jgi:mRNA capping enzyme, beta chain
MSENQMDPMAHPLFDKWESIINSHKDQENIEIEFRFGRKSQKTFDTNVGQETFQKLLLALNGYTGWEATKHTSATVYYFSGNKRLTVDEESEEQVGQIKTRVKVDDFSLEGHPFDIRLGISKEVPFEYDGEETSTEQKTKERWSFVRKNLSIDLSMVKGDPDDKDCDEDTSYQVEMEIVEPGKVKSKDELFKILYKVFDLLKCV